MDAKQTAYAGFGAGAAGGAFSAGEWGDKGSMVARLEGLGAACPAGFLLRVRGGGPEVGDDVLGATLAEAVADLEGRTGRRFGSGEDGFLLAVRPGVTARRVGVMPAVLNVGMTAGLMKAWGVEDSRLRTAADCRRRLLEAWGVYVGGVDREALATTAGDYLQEVGKEAEGSLNGRELAELTARLESVLKERAKSLPAEAAMGQLREVAGAMVRRARRPVFGRRGPGGPGASGDVLLVVQVMVLGNGAGVSGAGVLRTRDANSGRAVVNGRVAIGGQGEDAVEDEGTVALERLPVEWREAAEAASRAGVELERKLGWPQEVEFTVEGGRCWVVDSRDERLGVEGSVRAAAELVEAGATTREAALGRVDAGELATLLRPRFAGAGRARAATAARGLGVSVGAATGRVALSAAEAMEAAESGEAVVLVMPETMPEDVEAMERCAAVVTTSGGMTSHAAIVARARGICCVVGVEGLRIDMKGGSVWAGETRIRRGDWLSVDGDRGEVLLGQVATTAARPTRELGTMLKWADELAKVEVWANADTEAEAKLAAKLGARGIGLCRTEHMFFGAERLVHLRRVILAEEAGERREALAALLPMQRGDFAAMFRAMAGREVTIRLLDPPLHEFLPRQAEALRELAREMGIPLAKVKRRVEALAESNPMLVHRGCRLAVRYPAVLEMQVRAVAEAAAMCWRKGIDARPRIMHVLVSSAAELRHLRELTEAAMGAVQRERKDEGGRRIPIGTMIETPRAALVAGELAKEADFLSFGTNDLTQMTFGLSRDDAGSFLGEYVDRGLYAADPFVTLDGEGVGRLVREAVAAARGAKPGLSCGLCGEHGGDPATIAMARDLGLDYVSCSPLRLATARLAAGQAGVKG